MARNNKNPNANGKNPNAKTILGGSRKPQNPSHDSPSRPGQVQHLVNARPRVIKSPKPAPNLPNPKATVYQKPDEVIQDNQYPKMPHVEKKNMKSPKKEPSYVWKGVNVDTKGGSSLSKGRKR